jgi:hypothetical protein
MSELVAIEHLPGMPSDPAGNPYELTSDGRILVDKPEDFSFITQGLSTPK